jgi:hypothetical protein
VRSKEQYIQNNLKYLFYFQKLDPKYWEFTLTELGVYDVPAVVTYILKTTDKSLCQSD